MNYVIDYTMMRMNKRNGKREGHVLYILSANHIDRGVPASLLYFYNTLYPALLCTTTTDNRIDNNSKRGGSTVFI